MLQIYQIFAWYRFVFLLFFFSLVFILSVIFYKQLKSCYIYHNHIIMFHIIYMYFLSFVFNFNSVYDDACLFMLMLFCKYCFFFFHYFNFLLTIFRHRNVTTERIL